MKKQIFLRSIIGAPIGVTICHLITLLVSLFAADGSYYPVVPALTESLGSEINAVLVQTVCSILYGAVWGGLSVIWQLEQLSLLKMTVLHFTIASATTLPMAWFMQWMPHSLWGILVYFGTFFSVYLGIWISQYCAIKKRIHELNQKIREQR